MGRPAVLRIYIGGLAEFNLPLGYPMGHSPVDFVLYFPSYWLRSARRGGRSVPSGGWMVEVSSLSRTSGKGKPPLVLYSTQTYLKFRIQQDFIGKHRVWCSQVFDAEKQSPYALGAAQAPSSDPKAIYRDLAQAIARADDHNAKIAGQKRVLSGLAIDWHAQGQISAAERDEIVAMVSAARITEWRPLLFVIPYSLVSARVIDVPRADRASSEPEYIVPELVTDEFDIIEVI